jgi:hypothetical protein
MPRQNLREIKASLGYRTLDAGARTIDTLTSFDVDVRRNLSGLNLGQTYTLGTSVHLRNFWALSAAAVFAPARFDDREVGDGTALERARRGGGKVGVATDPRRPVYLTINVQAEALEQGLSNAAQATFVVHALPQLDLQLLTELTYTSGEPRFAWNATQPTDAYLFGRLDARSVSGTVRVEYAFTPQITLQTYAQLFLASGHYRELAAVPRGTVPSLVRLSDYALYQQAGATAPTNPDFEQGALNVNVVFRWEYRLGSTLFLAYSRAQTPAVQLRPDEMGRLNLGAIPHGAAVDTFLVKLTYWYS